MENIYSRTHFLDKNTIDGIQEYDLGSLTKNDFDFGNEVLVMVAEEEIGRPDLISYNCYKTDVYWWFLMWYNGIMDVWNDLTLGLVLKVPSLDRVQEFSRLKQNGQL